MDILETILCDASDCQNQKIPFTAIFDLDSTLFNVEFRTRQILSEFANDLGLKKKYPEASKQIIKIKNLPSEYHFAKSLEHLQLSDQTPEFYKEIYAFWKFRFFNSLYLKYDQPYDGAVIYVQRLFSLGARILYLTGRDVDRMGEATYASLVRWKFPLDSKSPLEAGRAHLVLKSHKSIDDALFKKDFVKLFDPKGGPVWFFENEPVNIHLVMEHASHVKVVYFDSIHTGEAEAPPQLPVIQDFILKAK